MAKGTEGGYEPQIVNRFLVNEINRDSNMEGILVR